MGGKVFGWSFWKVTLRDQLTYPQKNGICEDDFPNFPRWDMLVPWKVTLRDQLTWHGNPKTNIAPENRVFQKETSIPTIHVQVPC